MQSGLKNSSYGLDMLSTPSKSKGVTGCDPQPPREMERPTGFEPATSSLGSWHSATELRPPGDSYLTPTGLVLFPVLEGHVVRLQHLVAARLPVEALRDAVQIDLLVERHRRHFLDPQLVDPVILLEALLVVHDRLRLVDHVIEVLVEPVHEDAG